jgi:multidrug resistance efflux pump
MEAILLAICALFVWLIFIKFKWLPWNTTSQVIVVIIPAVGMAALILLLNVYAPSSSDVRVYKYSVPVVSQGRGRVMEVAVEEGNRLVKKGDVLFRVDPTLYRLTVNQLEAQLLSTRAGQRELDESLKQARGKVSEATGAIQQATGRVREVTARLELARLRLKQNAELASTGARSKFELERAQTDVREIEAQLDAARAVDAQARAAEIQARAAEQQIVQKLSTRTDEGEFAQVTAIRAQLENARWELDQTTVRSPCDCYVANLQLRPGAFVAGMPFNLVMTLVEAEGQVVALYHQNELHEVRPGDEAEFALETYPGRIIKAKVDPIVWAQGQGQGQLPASGTLPMTGVFAQPPGRLAVKFDIAERDRELFLAAGAAGHAAIYTEGMEAIHILRKVIFRVGSYTNWLIPKLH